MKDPREVRLWWRGLNAFQRMRVHAWLRESPLPPTWDSTPLAYAYTEMMLDEIGD